MSRKNTVETDQSAAGFAANHAVVAAEDATRRQIGQALHDDLQQHLYSIRTHIELACKRFESGDDRLDVLGVLVDLLGRTDDALEVVRSLSHGLSSSIVDVDGLHDGLERLAAQMEALHRLKVDIRTGESSTDLRDPDLVGLLLAVSRELLFNVAKHAGTDHASVEVSDGESEVMLRVVDDGAGFDERVHRKPEEREAGSGLVSIAARLASVGGSLDVATTSGRGSIATVRVPRP